MTNWLNERRVGAWSGDGVVVVVLVYVTTQDGKGVVVGVAP